MKSTTYSKTWNVNSSNMAKNTFNPIRNILESMPMQPNPEKPMISLSIGDPTVFGNLQTHPVVTEAAKEAILSGRYNGYAPSTGYPEARKAVAEYVSAPNSILTEDDVILTSGCSSALDLCISVLVNPGQNILVPNPAFPLYSTLANGLGIQTKEYRLIPELNWEADVEHLESLIDENTTAIIVNNPSNPCGSVYSEQHLQTILNVAERHCLPIIADEIYADTVFSDQLFIPMSSLTSTVPILSCGGIAKEFLVPGWRLGWVAIHDKNGVFAQEIAPGLKRLSQRILGPNTIVQGALPKILRDTPEDFFAKTRNVVQNNAALAFSRLSSMGLHPVMPQGAMYMMVGIDPQRMSSQFRDDLDLIEALVKEQSVLCLPGKCFNYPNYFRIVLTVPEETMSEALDRMEEFFSKYVQVGVEVGFGLKRNSRFFRLFSFAERDCSIENCIEGRGKISRFV